MYGYTQIYLCCIWKPAVWLRYQPRGASWQQASPQSSLQQFMNPIQSPKRTQAEKPEDPEALKALSQHIAGPWLVLAPEPSSGGDHACEVSEATPPALKIMVELRGWF